MKPGTAIKLFVYQPLCIDGKCVRCVTQAFPYCRIEAGDMFISDKRPGNFKAMQTSAQSKVESVLYNLFGGECIVILEKREFKNEKQLMQFANGKSTIVYE